MSGYFTTVDYLVFIALLLISMLIGIYHGFRPKLAAIFGGIKAHFLNQRLDARPVKLSSESTIELANQLDSNDQITNKKLANNAGKLSADSSLNRTGDYLTANASISALPITLSLLASFFSATALLGIPAEVYQYGVQIWINSFALAVGPLVSAFRLSPLFAKLNIMSMFEYLERRFGSRMVRNVGMAIYVIKSFFTSAIFMYGPATSLSLLTALDEKFTIALIGLIGTFYTTIGGIRAVIWTDFFQALVMFAALFMILIKGIVDVGGFENLWRINIDGGRLKLFDFNPDPFIRQSFWPLFIGTVFTNVVSYGIDQQTIQRFQAAKTKKAAQGALLLIIPGLIIMLSLCVAVGLTFYGNFAQCDPFTRPDGLKIRNPNQLATYFVINNLDVVPGAAGLFLGALFCASLSSVTSSLNSQASILWQDFFKAFAYFRHFDDTKALRTNKLIVLACGLISTGLSFLIATIGGNLIQISTSINGAFGSPLIGLFMMGLLFSWANKTGALAGAVFGFAASCWLAIGVMVVKPNYPRLGVSTQSCGVADLNATASIAAFNETTIFNYEQKTPEGFEKLYYLSYMWFSTFGLLVTIISGLLVSAFTGGCRKKADDSFLLFTLRRHRVKQIENDQILEEIRF